MALLGEAPVLLMMAGVVPDAQVPQCASGLEVVVAQAEGVWHIVKQQHCLSVALPLVDPQLPSAAQTLYKRTKKKIIKSTANKLKTVLHANSCEYHRIWKLNVQ